MLGVTGLAAQTALLRFEVASIKQRATDDGRHPADWRDVDIGSANGDRDFTMTNGSVGALILYAYPVQTNDVDRAPDWVRTDRYDVLAKASGATTRAQRQQMLQPLLAERFALKVRYAMEERPVYQLVMAKVDQRAAGLEPVENCAAIRATPDQQAPFDAQGHVTPCHFLTGGSGINSTGAPIASLATYISRDAGRPVIDATALQGDYAFSLEWNQHPDAADQDPRPPLTQSLEDRLGLKLRSARAPVRVLIVDHIERPSPD
jgi:uncharacterized protein (TIGR03435 family)